MGKIDHAAQSATECVSIAAQGTLSVPATAGLRVGQADTDAELWSLGKER